MRSLLSLVLGLFLLSAAAHAQPAPPAPAPAAPANPGVAPLFEKHTDFGVDCITCHDENPPSKPVTMPVCLSCHGTYDSLADKSDELGTTNAHASHNGELDCGNCHHVHQPSVNYCAQCHPFDLDVP